MTFRNKWQGNFFIVLVFLCCIPETSYTQPPPAEEIYSSLEWRMIGPSRGGRSCAVTGVPGKPNLFYFGATGGGVWKTTDGGRSWENISDGFFGGSIGSIAVAPSDPNVLYAGGGEKTVRGNVSYGYGVWRSEDAGKTWVQAGLENSRHIGRLRIHPDNPDIVYAAVMGDLYKASEERGVYKSTNGGRSWTRILFSNEDAGAVDLALDPTNHRILYACTWNVRRTPYSLSSGGEGSGIYKSEDEGNTWEKLNDNIGLPDGTWGISGIAVSPIDGERVYAIIENENGGVFMSGDGGKTWKKQNDDRALRQRAWYYTRIYADTEDINTIYVMNVRYHKSTDAGKSFTGYRAPHGDHHDLWIAPEDPDRMIIADDGGAQVTYDGGDTWSTYYNQPTAQFYRVTTDNHFPYRIYAAQQDNSTIRISHRSAGSSLSWESTAGGESAHIAVDPEDSEIVYGGSYGGFLTRKNHRNNTTRAINVWPDNPMGHGAEGMKYRFQWNFPVFFSPHDPDRLYTASQHLHMTTDEGQSWQVISPDLTRSEPEKLVSSGGPITKDNTGVEYYATIFAAAESPVQEGLIWVGSDDGLVHITRDGGENWEDITWEKMPKYLMINSIEPSPFDPGTCYVAGTQYKTGDYQPYLYKTTDFGKTWQNIVSGIPAEHFTRVLRADPVQPGLLYAGTESGMYISFNDGASWHSFQLNLPIVPITDLAIKDNNLIAATQGRSLWILDDLTVLHQAMKIDHEVQSHLFTPMPAYRMGGRSAENPGTSGVNLPGGVITHFFVRDYNEKEDSISIHYLDATGDTIQSFSSFTSDNKNKLEVEPGGNTHVWDLRYPEAQKFDNMILWWGSLSGPLARPGSYTVMLVHNGDIAKRAFEVLQRPDSEGSLEDIEQQFEFIQSVLQKVDEAHQSITEIRSLRKQINAYTKRINDVEVRGYAEQIDSIMTGVEESLYQTRNESRQDPLNYPIRLTNKMAHLNSLIQMGLHDFPPTGAAVQVRDELAAEIDAILEKWHVVKSEMVPQLNDLIRKKELDIIILEE